MAKQAALAAYDKHAQDVLILDLSELSIMCDCFVICSADSDVLRKTIADHIEKQLAELGKKPSHREGEPGSGWLLMDYGDVVVHIFSPEQREYYGLERLWGDARRVELILEA